MLLLSEVTEHNELCMKNLYGWACYYVRRCRATTGEDSGVRGTMLLVAASVGWGSPSLHPVVGYPQQTAREQLGRQWWCLA